MVFYARLFQNTTVVVLNFLSTISSGGEDGTGVITDSEPLSFTLLSSAWSSLHNHAPCSIFTHPALQSLRITTIVSMQLKRVHTSSDATRTTNQ